MLQITYYILGVRWANRATQNVMEMIMEIDMKEKLKETPNESKKPRHISKNEIRSEMAKFVPKSYRQCGHELDATALRFILTTCGLYEGLFTIFPQIITIRNNYIAHNNRQKLR